MMASPGMGAPFTGTSADSDTFPIRLWRLLACGVAAGIVCGTASYLLQTWLIPDLEKQPQGQFVWVLLFNILVWPAWLLVVPVVWRLASLVPIGGRRRAASLAFHGVASLVIATVHAVINAAVKVAVLSVAGQEQLLGRPLSFVPLFQWALLFTVEWEVLIYWGIVAGHHALRTSRQLQQKQVQEARLEARLVEAQLESLQRQLNPHFFFNALHAVSTLLHRDPHGAEAMLVRLGDLLRAVFRSQAQQEVPLDRELSLLEQYLDIQRVRFGGHLRAEFDVPRAARDVFVPVLILQPLAENAIKHGFAGRAAGGTIRISARQSGESLEITVVDDGYGRTAGEAEAREGVGLSNTRARLEHLYPGAHALKLVLPRDGGCVVTLSLPWREDESAALLADALDIPA